MSERVATEFRCVICGCRWLMHPPFPGTRTVTFSLKNAEHKPCADCDGPRFERFVVPVEVPLFSDAARQEGER